MYAHVYSYASLRIPGRRVVAQGAEKTKKRTCVSEPSKLVNVPKFSKRGCVVCIDAEGKGIKNGCRIEEKVGSCKEV